MAVYAAAFIAFALDLARRSAQVGAGNQVAVDGSVTTRERVLETVGARAGGSTTVASGSGSRGGVAATSATDGDAVTGASAGSTSGAKRSLSLRLGVGFTLIGFLLELTADVLRGIAASRVPWANMYEFSMTGTVLIVGVFLIVITRVDLRFLGTFITGLVLILLGISTVNYYVGVAPLPPALQSAWLVIHVFVASLGTAFFALGFALSGIQLLQYRRESITTGAKFLKLKFLASLPDSKRLENLAYRVNIVGFVFWTFTLIAGAVWAERAWGRYWGWDTKEVWTFIIWVIYAGYIHARATRGWRGSRSAVLAIIGFAAVLFNFGIVNVFFHGLHSYSGL
ncbi:c-type cytochrome biogenesis protein CcsB [Subtercola boreus]|uniref:C-type cytochrome biogenesis protein CcsB n=1 Tax=Subtercola boreus TaxID=120213 RepID=A0A3E0WFC2_9MICO|nr:c-type cytochrome biogenesis protein CcsB [Subtercola boreus]RFA23725.1 c-type cytochrome biogenesis protein CcsB [Subtercola boreus]RFA24116.1 c-type cytochrome biogenesis protein CcsB [Subtercola boreus]RFA29818.1 c-type cytochrome biogenesis protein CcsB [Subtercola boreus]